VLVRFRTVKEDTGAYRAGAVPVEESAHVSEAVSPVGAQSDEAEADEAAE
jgi:hypothetical protein